MRLNHLIKKYNYPIPKLREVQHNGANVLYHPESKRWSLIVDGVQWMTYDETNHQEGLSQVFSHYYIAEGHVVTTGLGFGIRESWLLNNPKVKSITCIEKDRRVMDIAVNFNPQLFDKVKIIIGDAKEYKCTCDTLLLDHYEGSDVIGFGDQTKKILSNINTKRCWFWTYETYLMHMYLFNNDYGGSIHQIYDRMKSYFRLPNLSERELKTIMKVYFRGNKKVQKLL